jgi:Citrate lyase beta subunit
MISFLMIVSDPEVARQACAAKAVMPFVDLERLGKAERQGHLDSWKSSQEVEDVTRIREAVPDARLVVRVNPLNDGSQAEIDDVVARGADFVMLPMFRTGDELGRFYDMLRGRAQGLPLFETAAAVIAIPKMVEQLPIEQLHIGLNDLHLDLQQDFIFQPLAEGFLEEPAAALRAAGIRFGIGGLARSREGIVSPEFLLGEHVRLGSTGAILSRTFRRSVEAEDVISSETDLVTEVEKLQAIYAGFLAMDRDQLEQNRLATADRIRDVVHLIRRKKEH